MQALFHTHPAGGGGGAKDTPGGEVCSSKRIRVRWMNAEAGGISNAASNSSGLPVAPGRVVIRKKSLGRHWSSSGNRFSSSTRGLISYRFPRRSRGILFSANNSLKRLSSWWFGPIKVISYSDATTRVCRAGSCSPTCSMPCSFIPGGRDFSSWERISERGISCSNQTSTTSPALVNPKGRADARLMRGWGWNPWLYPRGSFARRNVRSQVR